jgi:hypothetical protein
MPSLRYFLSTYDEERMFDLHGNKWQLVDQKKLPCSTDSYTFYLYERVRVTVAAAVKKIKKKAEAKGEAREEEERPKKRRGANALICEQEDREPISSLCRKRRRSAPGSDHHLDTIPFAASLFGADLESSPAVSPPSPATWDSLCTSVTLEEVFRSDDDALSASSPSVTAATATAAVTDAVTTTDPPSSVPTTGEEFLIDHIEHMRGNPAKNPNRLSFLVHWLGYDTATWEPYSNVKQTIAFYLFIQKKGKKLLKLLPPNIVYSDQSHEAGAEAAAAAEATAPREEEV